MDSNDIPVAVARHEEKLKSHDARISAVEQRQTETDKLVAAMTAVQTEQKYIKEDVSEIKTDVKALTERPVKKWDTLVYAIISGVVGIILGIIFNGGI